MSKAIWLGVCCVSAPVCLCVCAGAQPWRHELELLGGYLSVRGRRLSGAICGSGDVSYGVDDEDHRPTMAHWINAPARMTSQTLVHAFETHPTEGQTSSLAAKLHAHCVR